MKTQKFTKEQDATLIQLLCKLNKGGYKPHILQSTKKVMVLQHLSDEENETLIVTITNVNGKLQASTISICSNPTV